MTEYILYGLVMCGGNSSRMGTDKSRIIYHKKEQQYHVYEMLQPVCKDVFISCNREQETNIDRSYNFIVDENEFNNIGPLGGILSSFKKEPQANLLVVGCDYPYLTTDILQGFIETLKPNTIAAAFYNNKKNFYEPLLAYYSNKCLPMLMKMFTEDNYSLQYFLKNIDADKYFIENKEILKSIDNEIDMKTVKQKLNK